MNFSQFLSNLLGFKRIEDDPQLQELLRLLPLEQQNGNEGLYEAGEEKLLVEGIVENIYEFGIILTEVQYEYLKQRAGELCIENVDTLALIEP